MCEGTGYDRSFRTYIFALSIAGLSSGKRIGAKITKTWLFECKCEAGRHGS